MLVPLLGLSLSLLGIVSDTITVARAPIRATLRTGPITIDGRLEEEVWRGTPAVEQLIQSNPSEGQPATERSAYHIAIDGDAIYLGARLYDSSPDSIMALLTRRDREGQSDFVALYLDPYRDGRTGYEFNVSAAGVQSDGTLYNDDWNDYSWDGVWESAVQRDAEGWTVEIRIPLSQLRMHSGGPQVWGINVGRGIGRKNEVSYLVPRLRQGSGFVSRFVALEGLDAVAPRRRMEFMPYVTGRAEFSPAEAGNPFHDGSNVAPTFGGDLRLGLGGSLQLDATVNPDFGQVEVDPAVVNLSDVETFFEERRPFFVEGNSTFNFGYGGANNFMGFNWVNLETFYSRRIGRAPQGALPDASFHDVPAGVHILGATKLTGVVKGWNTGVLGALTQREFAHQAAGVDRWRTEVEPLTGYGVLRVQRDLAGGRHGIGMISTLTKRDFDDEALVPQLNSSALLAGVDGWLTLDADREWVMSGWAAMTRVNGTAERIATLQRASTHYYQRPDASHISFDPTRTSLSGGYGRLTLNRQSGSVLFNAAVGAVTPGFDNNDLGFVGQTDLINAHISSGYRWTRPGSWYQDARVQFATFGRWDFGGVRTGGGVWNNSRVTLKNFSSVSGGFFAQTSATNGRATRGGPMMHQPAYGEVFGSWYSDGRKPWQIGVEGSASSNGSDGGGGWGASLDMSWRPATNVTLSFAPGYREERDSWQFLRSVTDPLQTETYGQRYVFGDLRQRTLSADLRVNWIFSPQLSLELFAQPLVSSGRYGAIRELERAGTFDLREYGTDGSTVDRSTGLIDPDGDGPATAFGIGQPDFTFASLRGNAVLRWEYAAGSTLYLVWTQARSVNEGTGDFSPRRSFDQLFTASGQNVLMIKASYWLSR